MVASTSSISKSVRRELGGLVRDALLIASAVSMGITLYLVFMWVPTEQNLGISQRIFYFHVPLGWLGMVSIVIVAFASVMHLITGRRKWDDLAYSTAELGIIFATLILVTGAIWAKPAWGVWWVWDPKLTTTLVLWFIYAGYLMIRVYGPAGTQGKRFASVIALIGAIDAPIIYKATDWWRTAHPDNNIPSDLNSQMLLTLLASVIAFTILYAYMLSERYALRKSESDLDELYQKAF